MLKNTRDGIEPDDAGNVGPIKQLEQLKQKGFPLAYVGDVVGTGSSRKSATNSVLWFMGKIFLIFQINVLAVWYWVAKLRRFSSTQWKMPVHYQLKWMSVNSTWGCD